TGWLALWLGAACFISVMSLLVFVLDDISPMLWILGVRNYFMYIPLAFIVAEIFKREDLTRLARLIAILAVSIALICVKQFYSSPGGWINVGAGGNPPPMFADGILRTTGLLASDAQHVFYLVFTLSVLVATLIGAKLSKRDRFLLIMGGVATFT